MHVKIKLRKLAPRKLRVIILYRLKWMMPGRFKSPSGVQRCFQGSCHSAARKKNFLGANFQLNLLEEMRLFLLRISYVCVQPRDSRCLLRFCRYWFRAVYHASLRFLPSGTYPLLLSILPTRASFRLCFSVFFRLHPVSPLHPFFLSSAILASFLDTGVFPRRNETG